MGWLGCVWVGDWEWMKGMWAKYGAKWWKVCGEMYSAPRHKAGIYVPILIWL